MLNLLLKMLCDFNIEKFIRWNTNFLSLDLFYLKVKCDPMKFSKTNYFFYYFQF